jgi:hypothetical protein
VNIFIDARSPNAIIRLFSITLLERLLRQLNEMGIKNATVLLSPEKSVNGYLRKEFAKRYKITVALIQSAEPLESVLNTYFMDATSFILLQGDGVYDERVIRQLIDSPADIQIYDEDNDRSPLAIKLTANRIPEFHNYDKTLKDFVYDSSIEKKSVQSMNAYMRFLRKTVTPVLRRITDQDDLRMIENDLFAKTYKGGLELVGTYGYRIPVRGLTKLCAKTGITPNQITAIATVCRFGAIPFLAIGWLGTGLLLAAVFIILDSLDGKLARLSWRLSAVADKVDHWGVLPSRIGYYAALAYHFSGGQWNSIAVFSGGILILITLIDDLNWAFAKKYFKRSLYDLTELDARVHLFTIRRNDIFVLIIGWLTGLELYFFYFLCFWMIGVWLWHVYRLFWVGYRYKEILK